METSASFEARSAPSSYPTKAVIGGLICCDAQYTSYLTIW
jgi:hypothetical protein